VLQKFWKRKSKAVKNWRSRAWSIDPKVTNLTIIRSEESNVAIAQIEESFPCPSSHTHSLLEELEAYSQYYNAVTDLEQLH
jgi:hypothetical protein